MSETLKPDICVIGAGSGGLSVAAAAAAFGVSVVLIEKGEMGGDCLNTGCIPSKALIAAGKSAHTIQAAKAFGITSGKMKVNFQKVHDHVHQVIDTIAPMDSQERFEALGVQVLRETARFTDKKTVTAGSYEIKARRFVIATGSTPFVPPIPGLDAVKFDTNETVFDRVENPGSMIIIGGGPIGMEMAQAHQRLGVDVTVVEGDRALGKDDPELTAIVLDKIREDGVKIYEKSKVIAVKQGAGDAISVELEIEEGNLTLTASSLLVATGRKASTSGLGLEQAGIDFDRRGITVSKKMRTSNSRVYAIGDVTGGLQFTHMAGYHAGLVIRAILFRLPAKENTHIIPWCSYTDPELAHVGHSEQSARAKFGKISVLRWPYHENDRAQAERKTAGLIKIVTRANGKIEGVSIAGANAGEMMNFWAFAVAKDMKVKDILAYVSPYPTMSEIGKRAATSYFTPSTRKGWVRGLIGFLRNFG